jgi:hypothetical protein
MPFLSIFTRVLSVAYSLYSLLFNKSKCQKSQKIFKIQKTNAIAQRNQNRLIFNNAGSTTLVVV